MADDNNNPRYEQPLNDFPSINDVEEKPFYDDGSAPVVQTYNNIYNQQSNYNNPSSNTIEQTTPTIQYGEPNYSKNNIFNNVNIPVYSPESVVVKKPKGIFGNPKIFLVLSILLIIDQLTAIILQITMNSPIPLILVDNIAVIITAILYLLVIFKVIKGPHKWLGIVSIVVWFVGFVLEGLGMMFGTMDKNDRYQENKYTSINIAFMVLRNFLMFCCHPFALMYSSD